jgi:hypothetical protein
MGVLYVRKTSSQYLPMQLLQILDWIAREQAGIWGDTILEGDYIANGATRLESVQGLYQGQQLLGYRIIYSERAWYVGECNFDSRVPNKLEGCQAGTILEASFVTKDMSSWMRDETMFAHFINQVIE